MSAACLGGPPRTRSHDLGMHNYGSGPNCCSFVRVQSSTTTLQTPLNIVDFLPQQTPNPALPTVLNNPALRKRLFPCDNPACYSCLVRTSLWVVPRLSAASVTHIASVCKRPPELCTGSHCMPQAKTLPACCSLRTGSKHKASTSGSESQSWSDHAKTLECLCRSVAAGGGK